MPYLIKEHVTAQNVNGDTYTHLEGSVVSDWELSDFLRQKIAEGSEWYRSRFEPLLEHEAHSYRVKATQAEPVHMADGVVVQPPFDDYVGLHPTEIITRMRDVGVDKAHQIRLYEKGGMNRSMIVDFVTPSERQPWAGYNESSVQEILAKFSISSDPAVADAIAYEKAHKNRPVVVTYNREDFEGARDSEPAAVS